jgi:hypothetical protein
MTSTLSRPAPQSAPADMQRMLVPAPRGELSSRLVALLTDVRREREGLADIATTCADSGSSLYNEDLQISLLMLYELSYRGLAGVPDSWEWDPDLLAVRRILETRFESDLRELSATLPVPAEGDIAELLFAMTAPTSGPSMSRFMAARATKQQFDEFLTHRSVYQLKEADPHSWAIPRLGGRPKAALIEVQLDEYGGGRVERMHASLFAQSMRALGLDSSYGALVDSVPAVVLAMPNAMSMFGLHRRLLGAIVGHLAAFEMTSSLPNRLYGNGLRRLGFDREATLFFDEHVEADAVHEQIAGRDLAGGLVEAQPDLRDDVLFGAAACLALDDAAADYIRERWDAGRTSLRDA